MVKNAWESISRQ